MKNIAQYTPTLNFCSMWSLVHLLFLKFYYNYIPDKMRITSWDEQPKGAVPELGVFTLHWRVMAKSQPILTLCRASSLGLESYLLGVIKWCEFCSHGKLPIFRPNPVHRSISLNLRRTLIYFFNTFMSATIPMLVSLAALFGGINFICLALK